VREHLPKEKQQQAVWRLRGAWAKPSAEAAWQQLRACVKWLDAISPSAARSLEDGLAEAGFRRIRGHAHLSQLKAALVAHQNSELETFKQAA